MGIELLGKFGHSSPLCPRLQNGKVFLCQRTVEHLKGQISKMTRK
jgi:hypothetical protein